MSFSDLTFLFYFLPLFFAVYYILPFRFKNAALVLGSFAFYFIGAGARDTLLLSGVLLLHYALARAMAGKEVRTRKALLIIALAAGLFCLVYFKYAAFILENLGKLTGTAFSLVELALPLGVSFYLFQSAGYLIDVYRGEEAEKNLIDYAAFTIAFPQLTMGPILRYREWRGALKERTITREDVFSGFELFVVGLCFKVLLADQLAPLWASLERIGYEYLSTPLAWLGAVSYSLQLYFDFSGYSLMAMGLGQMLALPVPRNFDLPYTARSVSEFYRRWHITLGTWFRDYVYIPLGGSRKGKARTYINVLIVFALSGLWHGAAMKYVLWGLLFGVFQVIGGLLTPAKQRLCAALHIPWDAGWLQIIRVIITFGLSTFAWIFFRADSALQACAIIKRIVTAAGACFPLDLTHLGLTERALHVLAVSLIGLVLTDIIGDRFPLREKLLETVWLRYAVWVILLAVTAVCGAYGTGFNPQEFVYFQF